MSKFKYSDSRTADKFVLRMPDGMREAIAVKARENHRSMNSEIVQRLELTLQDGSDHAEPVRQSAATFACDLEGFKKAVAEFCKAAPTASEDGLEAGIKTVGLYYLGIHPAPIGADDMIATEALHYAHRRYFDRLAELAGVGF